MVVQKEVKVEKRNCFNCNDLKKDVQSSEPMIIKIDGTSKTRDRGDKSLNIRNNNYFSGKREKCKNLWRNFSKQRKKYICI